LRQRPSRDLEEPAVPRISSRANEGYQRNDSKRRQELATIGPKEIIMRSRSSFSSCCAVACLLFASSLAVVRAEPAAPSLKSILLEQLRGTHDHEEWFVPVKIAIDGLSPE